MYAACCIHENIYFIHEEIRMLFIEFLRSEEGFTRNSKNIFDVIKIKINSCSYDEKISNTKKNI